MSYLLLGAVQGKNLIIAIQDFQKKLGIENNEYKRMGNSKKSFDFQSLK